MKLKVKKKKLVKAIWVGLVVVATVGLLASSMLPAISALLRK